MNANSTRSSRPSDRCFAYDASESDIVALRYCGNDMTTWAQEAGFAITRCAVEPVEEFPMDALYLEGVKEAPRPC